MVSCNKNKKGREGEGREGKGREGKGKGGKRGERRGTQEGERGYL